MSDIWCKVNFFQNFDRPLTDLSKINVLKYDRCASDLKMLLSKVIT